MVSSPARKHRNNKKYKKPRESHAEKTEKQIHHVSQHLQSIDLYEHQKDCANCHNINSKTFDRWVRKCREHVLLKMKQSKDRAVGNKMKPSKDAADGNNLVVTPSNASMVAALALVHAHNIIKKGMVVYDEEEQNVWEVNCDIFLRFASAYKNLEHELNTLRQTPPISIPPPTAFNLRESAERNKKYWDEDITKLRGYDMPDACDVSAAYCNTGKLLHKDMDEISGAVPKPQHKMDPNHLYNGWDDGTYQLVYWPVPATKSDKNKRHEWNCAMIDSGIPHDFEETKFISRWCTNEFLKSPIHRRGGGAGGPVQVHTAENNNLNTGAISPQTTLHRAFSLFQNGFAKNPKFSHVSPFTGEVVERNSTAMDIHGNKFTNLQVLARMKKCQVFRRREINIHKSRFRSLLIATGCQLPVVPTGLGELPPTLANNNEEGLWQHLNDAIPMFRQHKRCWNGHDPTLTDFDILMICYSIQTGEMVNHQQLHCHCDTSKGHIVETLELIAMANAANIANGFANCTGQLFVPLQDHGCNLRPGRDLLHANLTHTMHVPDESRGVTNMSKAKHTPPLNK